MFYTIIALLIIDLLPYTMTTEQLEASLLKATQCHDYLISLTNSLKWTHQACLANMSLFKQKEWESHERTIYQSCSTIVSLFSEIEPVIIKEPALKRIYESQNTSGQFYLWKLYAENTIKVIDLGQQLAKNRIDDAATLEKKMDNYRGYLPLITAKLANSGNYFNTFTSLVLEKKALGQLHADCNEYTQLLNRQYLHQKKGQCWIQAHASIDKLYIHFEKQLKDTQHYEHTNVEKIKQIKKTLMEINYEKSILSRMQQREKNQLPASTPDLADEMAKLYVQRKI